MKHINPIVLLASLSLIACAEESEEVIYAPPADAPSANTPPAIPPPADSEDQEPMTAPPADGLCAALFDIVASEVPVTACEEVVASDCERIIGTLNDPYVDAVEQCIAAGGDAFGCLTESVGSFAKTQAHDDLATAFCDECTFGIPGCEELFYIRDSEWGLGTILLPFSGEVLDSVRAECTDGFTCAASFPTCAMDVIKARLTVDDSRECLMDEIL